MTLPTSWLLVHPPLLGPAVLGPLADELRSRGNGVQVPDLRDALRTAAWGWPERFAALAATDGPADVVVAFSGAGPALPLVAVAVGARRVVFLDAGVPAATGDTLPSDQVREMVGRLRRGVRIAAWPTWWDPADLTAELPDDRQRAAVCAEAVELPGDFYDTPVPQPAPWPADVTYVQLSGSYDADAEQARARGWTVRGDGSGSHLDVVTAPARIADLIG